MEDKTSDGVTITPGLRVITYDRKAGTVEREEWDGWYFVNHDDGTQGVFNGERMTTRGGA